jgi:hypothetical protein
MMDYDRFCRKCKSYSFDVTRGIVCGLTNKKPNFGDYCLDFTLDEEREERIAQEQWRSARTDKRAKEREAEDREFPRVILLFVIGLLVKLVNRVEDFFNRDSNDTRDHNR